MPSEKPFYENITLETIDRAIHDWFERTVDAHVAAPNTPRRKVNVTMATGERWLVSREKKGFRDDKGILILPIISIRRSSISPSPAMSALGTETPNIQFAKKIAQKTNDLRNLHLARDPARRTPPKPVVYEVYTIPFPDRSILTYEIQVQSQYTTQMNSILEKMFHMLDIQKSFVAPFHNNGRHPKIGEDFEKREPMKNGYVVGFFDSDTTDAGNFDEFTDTERIIRFTTSIKVPAVLQLDPEGEKPSVKVERTSFGLQFSEETVTFLDNPDDIDKIFGPR